jgi:excisionase family DNA binding protein
MPHEHSDDEDSITQPFFRKSRPPTPDVASYLKVSRSWVYHRAEAGLLPHLRVGGLLRFDPEVVRAFARR